MILYGVPAGEFRVFAGRARYGCARRFAPREHPGQSPGLHTRPPCRLIGSERSADQSPFARAAISQPAARRVAGPPPRVPAQRDSGSYARELTAAAEKVLAKRRRVKAQGLGRGSHGRVRCSIERSLPRPRQSTFGADLTRREQRMPTITTTDGIELFFK